MGNKKDSLKIMNVLWYLDYPVKRRKPIIE